MTEKDLGKYQKHYSENGLLKKIGKIAKKAGLKLIYSVLLLWYALKRDNVPVGVKATILGALGYFISIIDFIPDVTPIVGYADDLGAIGIALVVASAYINDEVKEKARKKLRDWFGDYDDSQLNDYEKEIENKKN